VKRTAALWLLLMPAVARSQPPLPPTERPRTIGPVLGVTGAESITLQDRPAAPLAPGLKLHGATSLAEVMTGDLVELTQDENGLVSEIAVLPRLAQRRPLTTVIPGAVRVARLWWRRGDRDYPDSLYAAEASLPLQVRSAVLEATAAYRPASGEPAVFSVLGDRDTVLWQRQLRPGETAAFRCSLGRTSTLVLRCRRPDGTRPEHESCLWGNPTVTLLDSGTAPLKPPATDALAAQLAGALKNVQPGSILIAQPRVIGLGQEMARDLQEDLYVAVARRLKVVGLARLEVGPELSDPARAAAKALGATAILASEFRYHPEGVAASLVLWDAESKEALAQLQAVLKP
jgi:hypothetical protein